MSEGDILESAFSAIGDGVGFAQDHPLLCLGVLAGGILAAAAAGTQDDVSEPEHREVDFDALVMEQLRESVRLNKELDRKRKEAQKTQHQPQDLLKQAGKTLQSLKDKPRLNLVRPLFSDNLSRLEQMLEPYQNISGDASKEQKQLIIGLYQEVIALENEYLEFDLRWKQACDTWAVHRENAARRFESNRIVRVPLDTTEGREVVEIDCDFWTHGALSDALKMLPPLEQDDETSVSVFTELAARADRLSRQADELSCQAHQAFVSSQVRIQLGVSVWEQFEERGWRMEREEDLFFDGEDERESLHLKLISPADDRLEFVFDADNKLMMRPEFEGVHNRSVIEQLSWMLQRVLQNNGITLEKVLLPE